MAGYAVAVSATATGIAAAPICALRCPAGGGARLREIWLFSLNGPGTSNDLALYRVANTPVPTASVLGQAEDPADAASTVNIDTAWSTAPTVAGSPLRKLRNAQAANFNCDVLHWHEQDGLVIPAGGQLVLWQDGAVSSALQVLASFVWEETE